MADRRICTEVIERMIKKIPKDKVDFLKALSWNHEDASFKSPEENLQWHRTSETLQKYIPLPTEDWEFEVLSIFSTMPIEDIKKAIDAVTKSK